MVFFYPIFSPHSQLITPTQMIAIPSDDLLNKIKTSINDSVSQNKSEINNERFKRNREENLLRADNEDNINIPNTTTEKDDNNKITSTTTTKTITTSSQPQTNESTTSMMTNSPVSIPPIDQLPLADNQISQLLSQTTPDTITHRGGYGSSQNLNIDQISFTTEHSTTGKYKYMYPFKPSPREDINFRPSYYINYKNSL